VTTWGLAGLLEILNDLMVLFAVFAVVLVFVAWRSGWFLGEWVDQVTDAAQRPPTEAEERERRARSGLHGAEATAVGDVGGLDTSCDDTAHQPFGPSTGAPQPLSDFIAANTQSVARPGEDDPHADIDADVRRQAYEKAIESARVLFPGHWPVSAVQSRPGWMLFDTQDFLGNPAASLNYAVPGSEVLATLPLYRSSDVRAAERTNILIATSRRKVIQSRWDQYRDRKAGGVRQSQI